jgi:hypothetical protein
MADSSYSTLPAKREITFRDLLTHTSGIDYSGIGSDKMKAIYAKSRYSIRVGRIQGPFIGKNETLGKIAFGTPTWREIYLWIKYRFISVASSKSSPDKASRPT